MNKFVDKDKKLNEEERLANEHRIKKAKELDVAFFEGFIESDLELAEFKDYLDIQNIEFEERYYKAYEDEARQAQTTNRYTLYVGDKTLRISSSYALRMNDDYTTHATDEIEVMYRVLYMGLDGDYREAYRKADPPLCITKALESFHKLIRAPIGSDH